MPTDHLAADIAREEGCRRAAYPDPLTGGAPWTIGVGHTGPEVHEGLVWTNAQIDAQLDLDIARAEAGLDRALPWWRGLGDSRQDVLVQMAFQLGVAGLLKFRTTLGHVEAGRFTEAADAMLASAWARQTPVRASRLAAQMRSGGSE